MSIYVSPEMKDIYASKEIAARLLPDGRAVVDRLAARHVLNMEGLKRIPWKPDELLEAVSALGYHIAWLE